MFDIVPTKLSGAVALRPVVRHDARGFFVKTVHRAYLAEHGIPSEFVEQYYSVSACNVLRGLHFQVPPVDHYKLVTCLDGEVLDVLVDLRRSSPTYGRHASLELSGERADSVFIPSGLAHGFYVRSERATVLYNVSTLYSPEHDTGIRWDSVGIGWPCATPNLSERDAALPRFAEFRTPF